VPITPTYPGVYIEEIRSGVRTITGVSTSVAAFVGYTKNGSINKAEEILSFADFERKFGGLAKDSPLSYTVQHFFMNGGQQAYVVRLAQDGTATEATLTLGYLDSLDSGAPNDRALPALLIKAREPGARASGMAIRVDYNTAHPDSTFNLRVEDPGTGQSEAFLGLTMNARSRRNAKNVINATSQLIGVETDPDALEHVKTNTGRSESGGTISDTVVDADHRQFIITLYDHDGPQLLTIYDGSEANRPTGLTVPAPADPASGLDSKITNAVRAIDPGREAYQSFECQANIPRNGMLTLISGEKGAGSFVRVTSAGTFDAARVLKLGVTNGWREIDAAAGIRPAPVDTTSGSLRQ